MPRLNAASVLTLAAMLLLSSQVGAKAEVTVHVNEAAKRVDVTIDGSAFTSYVWPDSLTKPVLYPLLLDGGVEVSRGFPLAPRPGERQDHPHHAGMWFNYGNVNGFDFWNNSAAIPAENRVKMGSVRQDRIVSAKGGNDSGELIVETTWIDGKGDALLTEHTRFLFSQQGRDRTIDRTTTLKALTRVVFHDDKEGLLGLRVARWLESPEEKGGIFVDAAGRQTKVEGASGAGATGVYLTSEGKQGDAAWGTRGRWCVLNGHDPQGHPAAIAIFDHPGNPGAPTYWHARGYGLFAVNPLGAHIFDPKAPQMDFTLEQGATATFRYRVLFAPRALGAPEVNAVAEAFRNSK